MHPKDLIIDTFDLAEYRKGSKNSKINEIIEEIKSQLPRYLLPGPLKIDFDIKKVDEDGLASYWRLVTENATRKINEYLNKKLYHLTQITCLKE
ncbi:hypothetical protein JW962_01640 [Candidatus Dojkabacteria bacterium]|nr:hypothetical protein [Candidatus Dojkabacteria bacterium]